MFFDDLPNAFPILWQGLKITALVVSCTIVGGIIIGTLLALMRLSGKLPLMIFAKCYVNLFRSVPSLMVLMWFYLAVPMLYQLVTGKYLNVDTALLSSIIAFTIFEGAYYAEIVRAGIQAIPKGQLNAARALGLTYNQAMKKIILPQAFRKMLPLLLQQAIILFQDSTLVIAVGLTDFFRSAYVRGELMGMLPQYIMMAGGFYFVVCCICSYGVRKLQQRLTV